MLSFLFWNLGKRPLQGRIARLAAGLDVDVLILAECVLAPQVVLDVLNDATRHPYFFQGSESRKLLAFARFPVAHLVDLVNNPTGGLSIRRLSLANGETITLALCHLPSRVNLDSLDQVMLAQRIARDVAKVEDVEGHRRTLLIGDLNMNPFDPGVTGSEALHAVMTRDIARREERVVQGERRRFFYNPMWGHFGDRTTGPPGTYYFSSSKPGNVFWNMYDQVLLRPGLMNSLEELRIVDHDGYDGLLTESGLPRESDGSDHLPLLFRLSL